MDWTCRFVCIMCHCTGCFDGCEQGNRFHNLFIEVIWRTCYIESVRKNWMPFAWWADYFWINNTCERSLRFDAASCEAVVWLTMCVCVCVLTKDIDASWNRFQSCWFTPKSANDEWKHRIERDFFVWTKNKLFHWNSNTFSVNLAKAQFDWEIHFKMKSFPKCLPLNTARIHYTHIRRH